ncbi:hypothetical protein ABIA39_007016 [Nocardia sp. GAS34]|uniref:hypothetical protein n=1 Tax=unclassified Nocardia TaxID=2637762 RepID=UPI003D224863
MVERMFKWRLEERVGYAEIADRLNGARELNPPPTPVDPATAVGVRTWTDVRDVLSGPLSECVWSPPSLKTVTTEVFPSL